MHRHLAISLALALGIAAPVLSQERVAGGTGETTLAVVFGRPVRFEEVTSAIVANWGESLRPTDGPTPSLRSGQAVRRSDVVASLAPR